MAIRGQESHPKVGEEDGLKKGERYTQREKETAVQRERSEMERATWKNKDKGQTEGERST